MLQSNYIMKYKGPEGNAGKDLKILRSASGVKILDDSGFPKMLLVSAGNDIIQKLKSSLLNWLIMPETTIPLPSTRKKLKKDIGLPAKKN